MPDMLCTLLEIPPVGSLLDQLRTEGITIRRPHPWEQEQLRAFIAEHFTAGWAQETAIAFTHQPVACFVAFNGGQIIGFADYECTRKNYFGPTGVHPGFRGKGIGKALFLAALQGLLELGYTYAIIGDAGPVDFYKKCVGAIEIPFGDGRGIYSLNEDPTLRRLR